MPASAFPILMVLVVMTKKKSQVDKFREAAKEAGTDESEERFNDTLKGLAKAPHREQANPKPGEEAKPKR